MTTHGCFRWLFHLLTVVVVLFACWAAALTICPCCGWELNDGVSLCTHCGAKIPAPNATSTNTATTADAMTQHDSSDAISAQALTVIRLEQKMAEESRKDRPELSYAFYENMLALGRLVRREGMALDAGKTLAETIERCRDLLTHTLRTCPVCGGSGKRKAAFQLLLGEKGMQASEGLPCAVCGGSGLVRVVRSLDELRTLLSQGQRDFDMRATALGYVSCGRAWLPPTLAERLTVPEQALVRSACPTPCQSCMGMGLQDCLHCKGSGRLPCTNKECKDGWIIQKQLNALSDKNSISTREPCPICQGTGWIPCSDCQGTGTISCKTCHGTGKNPMCLSCSGAGWLFCAKCHGTGKMPDGTVCPECLGKRERLCPKCCGEGCVLR